MLRESINLERPLFADHLEFEMTPARVGFGPRPRAINSSENLILERQRDQSRRIDIDLVRVKRIADDGVNLEPQLEVLSILIGCCASLLS